jgi:hypothetical protein
LICISEVIKAVAPVMKAQGRGLEDLELVALSIDLQQVGRLTRKQ